MENEGSRAGDSVRYRDSRRPGCTTDHRGGSSVQCTPSFSRDPEPEQSEQVAPRFRGRTSAALGKPPGHYRGTRGSSRGGRRRPAKGSLARHHITRDLKPERSTCLRNCRTSASKTGSAARPAPDRRNAARAPAHWSGLNGDARTEHSRCGDWRGRVLLRQGRDSCCARPPRH